MAQSENIRVLLVDDEEQFRTTAATVLARRGFDVIAVDCGVEATDCIITCQIDVVVLDVKMPGMNGNQTLRALKALKPEIEVIILTGNRTDDSEERAWDDGATAYLTKPCDIDLLARQIRNAFDERKRPIDFQ